MSDSWWSDSDEAPRRRKRQSRRNKTRAARRSEAVVSKPVGEAKKKRKKKKKSVQDRPREAATPASASDSTAEFFTAPDELPIPGRSLCLDPAPGQSGSNSALAADSPARRRRRHRDGGESSKAKAAMHADSVGTQTSKAVAESAAEWDPLKDLDSEQREAFAAMKALVPQLAAEADPPVDLSDAKVLAFATDATYCRYLRARGYSAEKAAKMLVGTLVWRAEYKPEEITLEEVWEELENEGKMYLSAHKDREGRPVVYMKPGHDNTTDRIVKVKYLVYVLEKALGSITTPGIETMTWVIDFKGYKQLAGMKNIRVSKDTASVLQNHYPERLGKVFMCNQPWVFNIFWGAVRPFIDKNTVAKVSFLGSDYAPIAEVIEPSELEVDYGGKVVYNYDIDEYASFLQSA
ncbi:random slug protein 5 [Thecamonas trahens ATCC 50062]|uniref:Random slug protein 5 n=1 Tax=Thecamonas trahens ATCC 50062 TaxID=461836 RepID=A0A0L0DPN5_THETB|nr:random slug protein 5 [Thecamonas trahens ATCC 50062]KNC54215.1 random slug protein 5 [Thecamonas trahens ATCC 50062]|eukprot:XP_013753854.1 random slug protein 5 [Thecamonas trahens ATCC 50062]